MSSQVDVCVDWLIARAAAALPDIKIFDGPPTGDLAHNQILVIAGTLTEDLEEAIETVQDWRDLAGVESTKDEVTTILCELAVHAGGVVFAPLRTAATGVLGVLEDALRDPVTWPGQCRSVLINTIRRRPAQSQAGAYLSVRFTVQFVCLA